MSAVIATLHWTACETCKMHMDLGTCFFPRSDISLSVDPLTDDVICDDYEEEE